MKRWHVSAFINQIRFIEQGDKKDGYFGHFFDSWNEAHLHLIERATIRLERAENELKAARKNLLKVRAMKKPGEVK